MARLFISHSSWNNDKAIEVRDWLAANGWKDVFLDLDPERGIAAGQRWKEALQKAAYRCEVVLALVSKEWLASSWCKAEVDAARLMGKKVIAALVGIEKSLVPPDLTDEQFIDLTGDPDAYRRLKEGLKRAGLDPTTFPFAPGRRPYPGFAYLEEEDAAVFFGRDAQIVRGLDEIRRVARAGVARMLVILGASGSGKSSFLRAGLWPRLKRDDLAWLPLPIVRPERAAISGKYGLAEALYEAGVSDPRFAEGMAQRGLPRSRIDIQDLIEKTDDGLAKLFAALRDFAQAGFSGADATPPTILLAIDQGEELFNEEGSEEARRFIDILTKTLAADPRAMAILVMRSDVFPLVQNDAALAALPKDTFTLDMMLEGSFHAVIEGPAQHIEPPLAIDPQLTDALLKHISGQDALPLLAFTLAHLYDNTRVDNTLTLAGYDRIGRVKGVIDKTVAQAFAEAATRGEAPRDKAEQLKLARSGFIPHLAQVNPAGQFVRRVAPREKIPDEARKLIDRFAEQRLLIRDRRQDAEVIEVAHEALLRQPPFSDWLSEDREFLLWRDRLSQARTTFEADERGLLTGRELAVARGYMQTRAERDFEPADLAFIRDSVADDERRREKEAEEQRKRETAEREEQERRVRDAERIAEEQKKAAEAERQAREAAERTVGEQQRAIVSLRQAQITQSRFLADQARQQRDLSDSGTAVLLALEALPDAANGTERPYIPEAEFQLDAALRSLRECAVLGHDNEVLTAAFSADGTRVVTASGNTAQQWDATTCQPIGGPLAGHDELLNSASFSPDGKRLVTASFDKTVRVWDAATGEPIGEPLENNYALKVTFSPDGQCIIAVSTSTRQMWDAATGQAIAEPFVIPSNSTNMYAASSPDGMRVVSVSSDGTACLWDAATGKLIGETMRGDFAEFNADGTRFVTVWDNMMQQWDGATGRPINKPLGGNGGRIGIASFSADGKYLVTSFEGTAPRLWDAASGQALNLPFGGHLGLVESVCFSPDGRRVLTASRDKTARLWDVAAPGDAGKQFGKGGAGSAAFNATGTRVVTASGNLAQQWDAMTGDPVGEPLIGHHFYLYTAEFSPDGTRIVTASRDETARLWDAGNSQPIGEPLRGHKNDVTMAVFSPDGKRIATASEDKTARLWDAVTGLPIGSPLLGHDKGLTSVAFSPEGARIVTASWDETVRLWDALTGKPIGQPLKGHLGPVRSAVFSPDGQRIVTASDDRTARIWDAATGQPIAEVLKGHEFRAPRKIAPAADLCESRS